MVVIVISKEEQRATKDIKFELMKTVWKIGYKYGVGTRTISDSKSIENAVGTIVSKIWEIHQNIKWHGLTGHDYGYCGVPFVPVPLREKHLRRMFKDHKKTIKDFEDMGNLHKKSELEEELEGLNEGLKK